LLPGLKTENCGTKIFSADDQKAFEGIAGELFDFQTLTHFRSQEGTHQFAIFWLSNGEWLFEVLGIGQGTTCRKTEQISCLLYGDFEFVRLQVF